MPASRLERPKPTLTPQPDAKMTYMYYQIVECMHASTYTCRNMNYTAYTSSRQKTSIIDQYGYAVSSYLPTA